MNLTFGARLRSQREQQHVELAAIAEETKINVAGRTLPPGIRARLRAEDWTGPGADAP
jgi:hypothetical protein